MMVVSMSPIILNSCKNDRNEIETINLISEPPIKCSEEILSVENIIPINDSSLLVINSSIDPFFVIIDRKCGIILHRFGKQGEGPKELMWPKLVKNDCQGNTAYIMDISLGRMSLIAGDSLSRYYLNTNGIAESCISTSDSNYVLSYLGGDKRFAVLGKNGEIINEEISFYPDAENLSRGQASLIYQGNLLKHPYTDSFIHYSRYGKIFEIFRYESISKSIICDTVIDITKPKYKINTGNEPSLSGNLLPENQIGFISGSVSGDFIYLLYCGKKMSDPLKTQANIIEKYDWNGNLISKYKLDRDIIDFFVEKQSIVAIGQNEDIYHIYKYKL